MPSVRAFLLPLALLLLGACQLNSFDSDLTGETTVPGSDAMDAGTLSAIPPFANLTQIDFASSADFQTNEVTPEEINEAVVTAMTLQVDSPAEQDFAFLDDVSFFARAGDSTTLIAERHDVSGLGLRGPNPSLQLDVTGADLTPYVQGGPFSIEVHVNGRPPARTTRLKATATFEFRVKVF
jgi:hypothetical protein